ncbi:preprotein translocase subunit YajC [Paenibacillus antri]|uniref:Preprotein translocase subunit YajC n=1 Tax=Paenibacillus antri TaxID=2582848 RepID=A0A5R9GAT4_9BACL|nr:preprotein translocase subunit YajC [Paenibacillus antri]TLS53562.1 preprotein translocase subunit YajC [Paenibacillus antri]
MFLLTGDTAGQGNILMSLLPFVLMFAIFYFLLIRPQQKRAKTRNMMLANVKKGDKVVTVGGMHGKIVELTDDTMVLLVNDTTRLTFNRSAIDTVVTSA